MDEEFEELCRQSWDDLVRTAFLITGDREEALDVAQESLARAFEQWDRVSRTENPGGWLHRVAANVAISRTRRLRTIRRHRPTTHQDPGDLQALDVDLLRA